MNWEIIRLFVILPTITVVFVGIMTALLVATLDEINGPTEKVGRFHRCLLVSLFTALVCMLAVTCLPK